MFWGRFAYMYMYMYVPISSGFHKMTYDLFFMNRRIKILSTILHIKEELTIHHNLNMNFGQSRRDLVNEMMTNGSYIFRLAGSPGHRKELVPLFLAHDVFHIIS